MLRRVAKEFGSTSDGSSATVVPGGPSKSSGAPSAPTAASTASAHPPEAAIVSELKQLRAQLQQRDNEIAILVNMVKQAGGAKPGSAGPVPGPSAAAYYPPSGAAEVPRMASPAPITSVGAMLAASDFIDPAVLADKERAMELFMQSYPKAQVCCYSHPASMCCFVLEATCTRQAINDNKQLLKDRYATAKALADQVNAARDSINRLKKAIEVRRTERAVQSVAELADADSDTVAAAVAAMPPDAEEITLKVRNKSLKFASFIVHFNTLPELCA